MTCAPAGGENLPTCLIRSRSIAMTIFSSSSLDLPLNSAPQWMYTGPGGGVGTSFTGRGALSLSSAMFWASANPDSSMNKQSGMTSHFSMGTPGPFSPDNFGLWDVMWADKFLIVDHSNMTGYSELANRQIPIPNSRQWVRN